MSVCLGCVFSGFRLRVVGYLVLVCLFDLFLGCFLVF